MRDVRKPVRYVLFRIHQSSNTFAIPVQYVERIEPIAGKVIFIPRSPNHGVYRARGKNISIIQLAQLLGLEKGANRNFSQQNLIFIADRPIGLLVETVLGVETLYPHNEASLLTARLVRGAYYRGGNNDIILGLDVPEILSLASAVPNPE